jgi:hypothetical protein
VNDQPSLNTEEVPITEQHSRLKKHSTQDTEQPLNTRHGTTTKHKMFSKYILDREIEADSEPESAMKACPPNHAGLEKKCAELEEELAAFKEGRHPDSPTRRAYSASSKLQRDHDELEKDYAHYKEDSEATISSQKDQIKHLRGEYSDLRVGSGEEMKRLKDRILALEQDVEDGEGLEEENLVLKVDKVQLQSELERYQGMERKMESVRKEKVGKDREYAAMERKMESIRKEKTQKDHEYAALFSAYEMLGEHQFHATNKLNSQSAKEPNSVNEVQELQVRNREFFKENLELEIKVGKFANGILDLRTKMEDVVAKIIQGFRARFGDRLRFTRATFTLRELVAMHAQTIREHGAMPLQMLALDLDQVEKQARQKVKLYEGEVDRIFECIFGGERSDDDESSGESSTQGDEPRILTPDTDSRSIREDLEPDNLYDAETDDEAWVEV